MTMKTLEVQDRAAWRAWLAEHHDSETEIWLIFHKKETGVPSMQYGDALDEALCYGWVDSLIKALDERSYARKFTPRKDDSKWSLVNKKRAEALIQEGRMTEHGLRKIEAARRTGSWDAATQRPKLHIEMPAEFAEGCKPTRRRKQPSTRCPQASKSPISPGYSRQSAPRPGQNASPNPCNCSARAKRWDCVAEADTVPTGFSQDGSAIRSRAAGRVSSCCTTIAPCPRAAPGSAGCPRCRHASDWGIT